MNVNYKQYCQQSAIKKELRQRKSTFENEQIQNIKPFMSHRKQKNGPKQIIQLSASRQIKLNLNNTQTKHKRQYNYKDIILQTQKQAQTEGNLKFEIEQKENQIMENQNDEKFSKLKRNADRIIQAKKLLQKYNTQKQQLSLKTGLNDKRKEVQSIIFDSKVRKFQQIIEENQEPLKISPETTYQHLFLFQQKASQINSDIEAALQNIEQLLKQAKRKKQQKSISFQPQQNRRIENLQKQFVDKRAFLKAEQIVSISYELVQKQQKDTCKNPSESQIQLQGDFKNRSQYFPLEYISFINRLSRQIQKDIDFTNKIQQLTKSNKISQVKRLIINQEDNYLIEQTRIDESFFKIQQSQIDPLEDSSHNISAKLNQLELYQQAVNLFTQYKQIQTHFNTKLYKIFSTSTIQLMFQQLSRYNFTKTDSAQVTIGHLLSYLNMRTNKCYRNRSFVKMLKRLSLKPNSLLTIQSFNLFTN